MAEPISLNDESIETSPNVKAIERQIGIVIAVITLLIIGLALLEAGLSHKRPSLESIVKLVTGIVIPFVIPGVKFLFSKKLKAAQLEWDIIHGIDPSTVEGLRLDLLNRAEYLARSIGAKISDLEIDVKSKDRIQVTRTTDNKITLSKRAAEELSNDEMDFVLAHEIGAIKTSRLKKTHRFMILIGVIAVSYLLWIVVANYSNEYQAYTTTMTFLLCAIILLLITYFIIMNRDNRRADYLALKETRNLDAARSAVIKMDKNYQQEEIEGEGINFDIGLSKRLATLSRIAEQLGLLTSSVQHSASESEG